MNIAVPPSRLHDATALSQPSAFTHAPLITPASLGDTWRSAFVVLPEWASRRMLFPAKTVGLVVSGYRRASIFMPLSEFASVVETCRYGGHLITHASPLRSSNLEISFAFPGAARMIPLRGFLSGSVTRQADVPSWGRPDFSASNAFFEPSAEIRQVYRVAALSHAMRLAKSSGVPNAATRTYAANLTALFREIDGATSADGGAPV